MPLRGVWQYYAVGISIMANQLAICRGRPRRSATMLTIWCWRLWEGREVVVDVGGGGAVGTAGESSALGSSSASSTRWIRKHIWYNKHILLKRVNMGVKEHIGCNQKRIDGCAWNDVTWDGMMSHVMETVTWDGIMSRGTEKCHMGWKNVTWDGKMSRGMEKCHVG